MNNPQWPTRVASNLCLTKEALKGWLTFEPGCGRDPMSWEVTCLVACWMIQYDYTFFAAATVLFFDCYLRPGVGCDLRLGNVVAPVRSLGYHAWVLVLSPLNQALAIGEAPRPSKTGEFNDSLKVGSPGRQWAAKLLELLWTHAKNRGDYSVASRFVKLFPFGLAEYEKVFKLALKSLKLAHLKLVPHCLRHGAPSHDIMHHLRTKREAMDRGFWRSYDSVRRYEKHGRITSQLNKLTTDQRSAANNAVACVEKRLVDALRKL